MVAKINSKNQSVLGTEKGMATIETVMLLSLYVLFMSFTVGFFCAVHSGILGSISARAYSFEVIRNRTNLSYRRNTDQTAATDLEFMGGLGFLFQGIDAPGQPVQANWGDLATVPKMAISIAHQSDLSARQPNSIQGPTKDVQGKMTSQVPVVFLKQGYGICLDPKCGS